MQISICLLFVRARLCFEHGVFRVSKNGMLKTNKPPAMRVVRTALASSKKLQSRKICRFVKCINCAKKFAYMSI